MPDSKLYLFQYGDTDRYALSGDVTGCNLPKDGHPWLLRADLEPEALEGDLDGAAEEVLRKGYCILRVTEPDS